MMPLPTSRPAVLGAKWSSLRCNGVPRGLNGIELNRSIPNDGEVNVIVLIAPLEHALRAPMCESDVLLCAW